MRRHAVRAGLAGLALILLAGPLLRIVMADLRVASDPEAALAWLPSHAGARAESGQAAANREDWREARRAAHALLDHSPLSGRGYQLLARAEEARGDAQQAVPLYRLAARRAPRERHPHAWLASHHAARGQFDAAIAELDQLLRIAPATHDELAPSLAAFVAIDTARAALVRRFAGHDTPWRARFLTWFAAQPASAAWLGALFSPLRTGPWPLTEHERSAWIERLLRDGAAGQAHFLWVDGLPAARREAIGNVHDGGFEWPADNAGFGWRIGRVPGASIRFEPAQGAHGRRALVIDFHDRRVPFAHVQQRLALPVGRYALRGRVRLDGLRNERGLVWQVLCGDGRQLARSDRFTGSSGWRDFAVGFERPAADCPLQLLQLRLDARIAPEQMIGGRVLFDDLRVVAADD